MRHLLLIPLFLSISAFGMRGYDSCYQLYAMGAMYPVICLDGTTEEGIGGAGVRLTVFRTNTNQVRHCMTSTAVAFDNEHFVFEADGVKELIFENIQLTDSGLKTGDAVIGSTRLKFMELDSRKSQSLQEIAAATCNQKVRRTFW